MAETVILVEQTFSFSAIDDNTTEFSHQAEGQLFSFVEGENYVVKWDGLEYRTSAVIIEADGLALVVLGNGAIMDISDDSGEPFVFYFVPADYVGNDSGVSVIATSEQGDTHTVAIYLAEEDSGIVVKDRTGTDVEHIGAKGIRVRTLDGGTKTFVDSDNIVPLEVIENGTYTPSEGVFGYSPVTVDIPDPVLQEKTITENGEYTADDGFGGLSKVIVEVAGSGGGLLETPVVAEGTFTPSATTHTLNHNLGVVPDCIAIRAATDSVATTQSAIFAIGFRTGVVSGINLQQIVLALTNGGNSTMGLSLGIETSGNSYLGFRKADATSVTFGGSWSKLQTGKEYTWTAVRFTA